MTVLIESINNRNSLAAIQALLVSHPSLLDTADPQGNTPLHYAVTLFDLPLIHFLVQQGADLSAKNCEGETPADWWRDRIKVVCLSSHDGNLERLPEEIKNGNEAFVADCWTGIGVALVRYPEGETLLHLATRHLQLSIIKLILNKISNREINRLLHRKNSRGETPGAIAQVASLQGRAGAQAIVSFLQEKEQIVVAAPLNTPDQALRVAQKFAIYRKDVQRLHQLLSKPVTQAGFASLRPLLPALCGLAWITCEQAKSRLSSLLKPKPRWRRRALLGRTQSLLQQLFGRPYDEVLRSQLQQKVAAVTGYFKDIILQKQIYKVIELSNEKPESRGWSTPATGDIFLNPMQPTNLIGLVETLIHEVTHLVNESADFTYNSDLLLPQGGYLLSFSDVSQLASIENLTLLSLEKKSLLETWQRLLGQGDSGGVSDEIKQWLAANNADTQAAAILGLAAQHNHYASFDRTKTVFEISGQFLSYKYLKKISLTEDKTDGFILHDWCRNLSERLKKSLTGPSVGDANKGQLPLLALDAVNPAAPSGSSSLLTSPEEAPTHHSASTEDESSWSDVSSAESDSTDRPRLAGLRQRVVAAEKQAIAADKMMQRLQQGMATTTKLSEDSVAANVAYSCSDPPPAAAFTLTDTALE